MEASHEAYRRCGSATLALVVTVLSAPAPFLGAASAAPAATSSTLAAPGTEAQLPRQKVLRRALRADPEQEYFLYVPAAGGRGARLFVTVHGISRNAEEHASLFAEHAEAYGVVLVAPYFVEAQHGDYQRLGRAGRGPRADAVLDTLVAEVASLTGASTERIYLFGYSGGAQFAHRYVMAHPQRVARAVIGAAGWYTFPDQRTPYPYGIGASAELPSVSFDPERFLRVPMLVLVGEQDVTSESLRRNDDLDRQQGATRLERARNWVAAMRAEAAARGIEPAVSFAQVPDIRHSFRQFMKEGRLGELTFGALFGHRNPAKPGSDVGAGAGDERRGSRIPDLQEELLLCSSGGRR